jgi:3,4-dihydroxy-2-butanone 4-phosphate synthase
MSGWRENEARSQALFREVNEHIEGLGETFTMDGEGSFICECGNPECRQAVGLTRAEYERIREHASRFVVALNHENPETESVVEQNDRFAVVESFGGEASRIARETDPRSQAHVRARAADTTAAAGRSVR